MIKKIIIGMLAGIVNGLFSTGGGMILVPAFIHLLKVDDTKARGTSVFCILPMVITSSFFYYKGNFINWKIAFSCAIGGTLGGYIRSKTIKKNTKGSDENSIYNVSDLRFSKNDIIKGIYGGKMFGTLIGLISGIVTGTGMGGGTILIFLLSFLMGVEQHVAQATNLIFFIPTSIIAILVNFKNKNIDTKLAITISLSGILGAIIGANISVHIDVEILKKCFGIFLAIIAINEIYSIFKLYSKKYKNEKK